MKALVGNRIFDLSSESFRENSIDYLGRRLLQPIVALRPEEELRLRFYIDQIIRDRDGVLGKFDYYGPSEPIRDGVLRQNRSDTGGHNCASWICLAPIGAQRMPLSQLVGAHEGLEVFNNPGWWNYFLTGAASVDRIPLIVYWTPRPLDEVKLLVKEGQPFPKWFFNLK